MSVIIVIIVIVIVIMYHYYHYDYYFVLDHLGELQPLAFVKYKFDRAEHPIEILLDMATLVCPTFHGGMQIPNVSVKLNVMQKIRITNYKY